jgi:hypothetical protein
MIQLAEGESYQEGLAFRARGRPCAETARRDP